LKLPKSKFYIFKFRVALHICILGIGMQQHDGFYVLYKEFIHLLYIEITLDFLWLVWKDDEHGGISFRNLDLQVPLWLKILNFYLIDV
jgi:hypothetical protein